MNHGVHRRAAVGYTSPVCVDDVFFMMNAQSYIHSGLLPVVTSWALRYQDSVLPAVPSVDDVAVPSSPLL